MQRCFLFALTAALSLLSLTARASDPDALWKIVHEQCVINTAPCVAVDHDKGFAVLKDRNGVAQYLLIPTDKVIGIEDPAVLSNDGPNYFALAWDAKFFVRELLNRKISRDDISLAINSVAGRTQNQLHIHVDCLRADVRDAVKAVLPQIGNTWAPLPVMLAGHPYRAMRISGQNLVGVNPFALAAPDTNDLAHTTLVVLGETFADGPGFVLLAGHADLLKGNFGSGEELQDHDCKVAQESP